MDLYSEELKVWKECWEDWDGKESRQIDVELTWKEKMPGSFEW